LSTSEEYFSTFSDKSKFILIKKYFHVSFKIDVLYQNFISFLDNISIFLVSKLYTFASKKLFSASNQKHHAFQKIAHHIVQGNPTNLCQRS